MAMCAAAGMPGWATVLLAAAGLTVAVWCVRRVAWLRREAMFFRPGFSWPTVSLIVPAHNEERYLAATLHSLKGQIYPGAAPEVIVALNGCTDNSRAVAEAFPGVTVVESERKGISFGRNFGAASARGELLFFIDADTLLSPDAVMRQTMALHGHEKGVVVLAGCADRGGVVVRWAFHVANLVCRLKKVSPPGPSTAIRKTLFDAIGGFDENLPQGTVSDFILRARNAGATYLWTPGVYAYTSIRRFEKTGVIRQMLDWNRNHGDLKTGKHANVAARDYEDYR